jgi:peptidoglycan hydrolase CwlO-like protein
MNIRHYSTILILLLIALSNTAPVFALTDCYSEREYRQRIMLRQLDDLQKRLELIDHQINQLHRQKNDCDKDIEKLKFELEHVC